MELATTSKGIDYMRRLISLDRRYKKKVGHIGMRRTLKVKISWTIPYEDWTNQAAFGSIFPQISSLVAKSHSMLGHGFSLDREAIAS